jgi:hypothetical protein
MDDDVLAEFFQPITKYVTAAPAPINAAAKSIAAGQPM